MESSLAEQSEPVDSRGKTIDETQARVRILAAALDELQVWSFERFSAESVADRAAVDPVDVHRLWTSPEQLIVDAIVDHAREVVRFPDTGCTRRDLAGHLASLAEYVNGPIGRALLRKGVIDPKNWAPSDVRGHLWKAYANAHASSSSALNAETRFAQASPATPYCKWQSDRCACPRSTVPIRSTPRSCPCRLRIMCGGRYGATTR